MQLLTLVGASLPSFQFQVHGLAGVLANLGRPGASTMDFSLMGSAAAIAGQAPARYAGDVGVWSIAAVYLAFALLTPLLLLCNLAALWWRPLTVKSRSCSVHFPKPNAIHLCAYVPTEMVP